MVLLNGRKILSVDLFDTLLLRLPNSEYSNEIKLTRLALSLANNLNNPALEDVQSALRTRKKILFALKHHALYNGKEPEIKHTLVYRYLLEDLGFRGDLEDEVLNLKEQELELHYKTTVLNPEVLELIKIAVEMKLRVIAISDMYLNGSDLLALLIRHGINDVSVVYASCDFGLSKYRGRLFDHVLSCELVNPEDVLHVGDNLCADVLSARERGIRSIHYR